MKSDQAKWNNRYKSNPGPATPSALLKQHCDAVVSGRALDIACGNGRNSLALAQRGFDVDAVDISDVAIGDVKRLHKNISACCRDLDSWVIPESRYHLIVNINFLSRRLFPQIYNGLKPGGRLIFQAFVGKPGERYCLEKGELRRAFAALDIILYREIDIDPPGRFSATATLVAGKP